MNLAATSLRLKSKPLCSVEAAVSLIDGKWKCVILWQLLDDKTLRFNELRRRIPGATQRMMTNQLRELERDGLVHREIYPQVPPKVEYSLTGKGQSLAPILLALREWGDEHVYAVDANVLYSGSP
ncbi:winged helix-turn-helix transcriptional regulator [Rhizobium sp.]|uniref:winged helix-turn-helix transcriptional regulator n=1 Tax=Rhizobium sp. TaxID=391 RepID=UPI0028AA39BE